MSKEGHWRGGRRGEAYRIVLLGLRDLHSLLTIRLEDVNAFLPGLGKGLHEFLLASKKGIIGVVLNDFRELQRNDYHSLKGGHRRWSDDAPKPVASSRSLRFRGQ